MTTEPTRVLADGTLRYWAQVDGKIGWADIRSARVFVIDYSPTFGGGTPYVTVVAREPMHFPHNPIPSPVGSIHHLPAYDEAEGDLLTLDVEALVPA